MSGPADYLDLGSWNASCSMCGGVFKAFQLRKHWQGQYRCDRCWEARNAQDFVRATPDVQTPPWTQLTNYTAQTFCTPNGCSAVPGQAEPGCAYPGYLSPAYNSSSDI